MLLMYITYSLQQSLLENTIKLNQTWLESVAPLNALGLH